MTADDRSGRRLTDELGPASKSWSVQTRLMYEDVLKRFPHLARADRRRLKTRLAGAYKDLAKHEWRAGRPAPAAANLIRAVHLAPWRTTFNGGRMIWRMAFAPAGSAA